MSEQARHFTQSAERVLALAQEEAEQRGRKAIDTEHLLLALLREEEGSVGQFLQALGLDFRQVKSLTRSVKRRRFTPRGNNMLDMAQEEADRRAGGIIDTDHILLALLRDNQGGILQALGLDLEQVEALLNKAGGNRPPSAGDIISTTQPQPLFILDENGNMLTCNQSARELLDNHEMDLWNALGQNTDNTAELTIGARSYLIIKGHLSGTRTIAILLDISHIAKIQQDKEDLLFVLLHDLLSPLTVISGWAGLVQHAAQQGGHEEEHSYGEQIIEQIILNADHMRYLIGQELLSLQPVDASGFAWQPCDLRTLVDEAITDIQGTASYHSVRPHYIPPADGCRVSGDDRRLSQMLMLPVGNAIQHAGGSKEVKIALSRDESHIQLCVQDQGPSIGEDEMPHIFDKYEVHRGIGLWKVKAIVEAHGGTIETRNMPEGGVEFVVRLPAWAEG